MPDRLDFNFNVKALNFQTEEEWLEHETGAPPATAPSDQGPPSLLRKISRLLSSMLAAIFPRADCADCANARHRKSNQHEQCEDCYLARQY
uniref:hypothetical protein n=1 Tax=Edaphosphingomonas laterariae TaxID=861865 RepID=UPI00118196E4|nr:hypothetical protein [Sphingomonas laterariae]